MKIPVIGLAMMWTRRLLAAACFFALLWGGVRPVLAPFWGGGSHFPTIGERLRSERSELRCFAEGVFERTPQRAVIFFLVPPDDSDGGLVNDRVPGRGPRHRRDAARPVGLDRLADYSPRLLLHLGLQGAALLRRARNPVELSADAAERFQPSRLSGARSASFRCAGRAHFVLRSARLRMDRRRARRSAARGCLSMFAR